MRLRLNGSSIKFFDTYQFKKMWFSEGHLSSDTVMGKRKKELELVDNEPVIMESSVVNMEMDNVDEEGFPILPNAKNAGFKDPERSVINSIFF